MKKHRSQSGVTLIEMLIVVSIIAVMAGIMFPSATSGLDSIRLKSAADSVSSFLQFAQNRTERLQMMIDLTISKRENAIAVRYPDFERRFEMPAGVTINGVLPEVPEDPLADRHFLLYPGGAPPRIGVRIGNSRGAEKIISLDPVTGIPVIEGVVSGR